MPELRLSRSLAVPETRYQMYLKIMPFNMVLFALDSLDDSAAARLIGMKSQKTIERAREGGSVGVEFMANTIAAFKLNYDRIKHLGLPITLDTFFEEGTREERAAEQTQAAA